MDNTIASNEANKLMDGYFHNNNDNNNNNDKTNVTT